MNPGSLASILKAIEDSAQSLLRCLEHEISALNEKQYETLISLAQEKQQLVEELDRLDAQRRQYDDSQNFSDYLLQHHTTLVNDWNSIRSLINQCMQQNSVNGRLLQRYHRLSQETMSLLTGKSLHNDTTYGRDGLKQGQGSLLSGTRA